MTAGRAIGLAIIGALSLTWALSNGEHAQKISANGGAPAGATGQAAAPPPPAPARQTRCTAADFKVEKFNVRIVDECRSISCPSLKLTGYLRNNCALPAGAQVKIIALDNAGNLVSTEEGWPASVRNIAPGDAYAFDLGPLIRYQRTMDKFSIQVIDARTW